jgi:hypothetical protein
MDKVDLVKELGDLYRAPNDRAVVVEVPTMRYLMIDGEGNPNTSPDYITAVEALYAASYTIKFKVQHGKASVDYKVMPLEGLWWSDDMSEFSVESKEDWSWTAMIAQPQVVTSELVEEAIVEAAKKKGLSGLDLIRFEELTEGLTAQIIHLGPYSEEGLTIQKLHSFIAERGYVWAGKHHEIYLGDPRRTAPERLKTVIRQPVAPAAS